MKKVAIGLGIAGAIIVILGFVGCSQYNGMVSKQEAVKTSWAQVDTVLQSRADLVPQLVSTVKGYAKHETEVFTMLSEARAHLASAATPKEALAANQQISTGMARLIGLAEDNPELKANENFLTLQAQLEGVQRRIDTERRRYNQSVKDYNLAIKRFPGALFAGAMGFTAADYFKAEQGAQKAPEVKF
ncbi:MAG TPA: LemA family protein [Kofleriaceae bacterium]|nr:LemA family protein [Kofleriaceae bacterium]